MDGQSTASPSLRPSRKVTGSSPPGGQRCSGLESACSPLCGSSPGTQTPSHSPKTCRGPQQRCYDVQPPPPPWAEGREVGPPTPTTTHLKSTGEEDGATTISLVPSALVARPCRCAGSFIALFIYLSPHSLCHFRDPRPRPSRSVGLF